MLCLCIVDDGSRLAKVYHWASRPQKLKLKVCFLPRQDVNQVPGFVASDLISTHVQDLVNLNFIFTSPYPYPIMFQTCYDLLTLPLDIRIHDANDSTRGIQIRAPLR
jgi:hypothetical protein